MMQAATAPKIVREIPANPQTSLQSRSKYIQLRVAAYCRVSTDQEEQQLSFETQVETYTDKIQRNPEWCMAGIFADEGISGTNANKRPEFMRMIRMCKQGKIDLVLTKSISRFSRNTLDCLKYVRMLKEMSIPVIFEKEGINSMKLASEMTISLLGSFAQSESESLSGNVKWGKQQSAKKGNVAISYGSFLGYRKGEDGKAEIVPEEAKVIKMIYDSYLAGKSLQQIKVLLEENGHLSPMGKTTWSVGTLKSILSNEKYKGDAILQKTYVVDCISKKSKLNNGELPKYYVENSHPAIIGKATFDRVQEEMARRSSKRKVKEIGTKTEQGKYSSKYALTELLICGNCGTPYRRVTWAKNGKKKIVWRCINRIDYGTKYCKDSPSIEEYKLQNAIANAIEQVLDSDATIFETLKLHIKIGLQGNQQDNSYAIELKLKELNKAREELINLSAANSDDERYDDEIMELYNQISALKIKLEETRIAKSSSNIVSARLDNLFKTLDSYRNHPIEYDDQAIRQLIECVKVVSADKIKVIFLSDDEVDVGL